MPHKSNFEGESHAKLRAMVESSDPAFVMDVGNRLTRAHQVMNDLGNELLDRMNALDWQGAAADAFKDWGTQVGKATLELSSYSGTAGSYMTSAGETLSTAKKAMPEIPEQDIATVAKHRSQPSAKVGGGIIGGLLGGPIGALAGSAVGDKAMNAVDPNWVSDGEAAAAQTRIDAAHQQAIAQMEKVGQSYEESTSRMQAASIPVFPPTPEALMPPRPTNESLNPVSTGRTGTGSSSSGRTSTSGTVKGVTGISSGSVTGGTGRTSGGVKSPVTPPTTGGTVPSSSTGIDSATLAPPPPTTPGTGPVMPGPGGTPPGGSTFVPPPAGGFPGGTLPGKGSGPDGVFGGGKSGFGGGKSRPGYSGGVIGEGESGLGGGSTRRPGYGGTTIGAEEGAHEGTTGRALGRGGAAGRGATSGAIGDPEEGHGAAGGAHGGAGGRGGSRGGSGRRLATEEGGMVGGRRGRGAAGEFTPGGSGLRSRGGAAGEGPEGQGMPGGSAGGRKSKDKRGQRPDYLVEDEETWMSGSADPNPTVIE